MGSAAFGNVARAALGFARDTETDHGSCVISQVKNNLGRLDLPSLRYRIDEAIVDTEDGPAEVGKLVMLGESDRSVADILRDKGTDEDRAERNEVDQWLTHYLTDVGGKALAAEVIAAARRAGFLQRGQEGPLPHHGDIRTDRVRQGCLLHMGAHGFHGFPVSETGHPWNPWAAAAPVT
jgi:hypothetical protein